MSDIKIGLIGGTGLGAAVTQNAEGRRHEIDTPFGRTSDAIIETTWAGLPVLILSRHGPGHLLNPSQIPYRANIFALKQLGCTHILASGAVGSLREEYKPRHLVIPEQIIDRTIHRPSTFFEHAAVHVEMAEPFSAVLRRILIEAGVGDRVSGVGSEELNPKPETRHPKPDLHPGGCYLCMEGPAFSTRSESLMHRLWGADLVGMTLMPEAKLAREAEISYALAAMVTDYDSWKPPLASTPEKPAATHSELLAEIRSNLDAAVASAATLMRRAVELMAGKTDELKNCPAQRALESAIWSDKSRISPEEREKLAPLWAKYL